MYLKENICFKIQSKIDSFLITSYRKFSTFLTDLQKMQIGIIWNGVKNEKCFKYFCTQPVILEIDFCSQNCAPLF